MTYNYSNICGRSNLPEYKTWCQIRYRCTNPNLPGYKHYGARGITVCAEWVNSFDTFLADMGPRPSYQHSIERVDNSKGYSPQNCRWATFPEQQRNKRNNLSITWDGRTQIVADWAKELGVSHHMIASRLRRGWTVARTMTTPFRRTLSWRRGRT